jgi:nickel transport protein
MTSAAARPSRQSRLLQRSLFVVPFLAVAGMPSVAYAHKLKVFAAVEDKQVHGYAFFIGGGRAADAAWKATTQGSLLASGRTDEEGRFAFAAPPRAADTLVTVDTGEGHVSSTTLPASRFGAPATTTASALPAPQSASPDMAKPADAAIVEAAVQRQIAPLLERIEQMDSRLRLTDVISGTCLILGLGGMALWARGKRRT